MANPNLNPYQFSRFPLVENRATLVRAGLLASVRGGYRGSEDINPHHTDEFEVPDHLKLPSTFPDLLQKLSGGELRVHPRQKSRIN